MNKVTEKAWQMYQDYMLKHYDEDSPRTRLSELLDIAKESPDYFPQCHADISSIYYDDFKDYGKSKYHADIARKQNPNNVLAIIVSIYLNVKTAENQMQKTYKGVNAIKDIPVLGSITLLSAVITKKLQEDTVVGLVITPNLQQVVNDVKLITEVALNDYFDPDDGYSFCSNLAEMLLTIQDEIRKDKRLYPTLKTSIAKALFALPWERVTTSSENEKNDKAKLLRRIKAEMME